MAAQRTAKRLLLGREIAHMIRASDKTLDDAAKILATVRPRVAELMEGTRTITKGDLKMLAEELGFDEPSYLKALEALRVDSGKRQFWTSGHLRAYHEDFRLMVDLERESDLLRTIGIELVPGLLQCESYIWALNNTVYPSADQLEIAGLPAGSLTLEEVVTARLERQRILDGGGAPEYRAVLSESCLRREYGGHEVMHDQCEHLLNMAQRHNISLQVVPFTVQPRGGIMSNPFVMVRVPSPGMAGELQLVYIEGSSEFRYIDDKKALTIHERDWASLTMTALDPEDSIRLIETIMKTYH
jgi:hypothetical protein